MRGQHGGAVRTSLPPPPVSPPPPYRHMILHRSFLLLLPPPPPHYQSILLHLFIICIASVYHCFNISRGSDPVINQSKVTFFLAICQLFDTCPPLELSTKERHPSFCLVVVFFFMGGGVTVKLLLLLALVPWVCTSNIKHQTSNSTAIQSYDKNFFFSSVLAGKFYLYYIW